MSKDATEPAKRSSRTSSKEDVARHQRNRDLRERYIELQAEVLACQTSGDEALVDRLINKLEDLKNDVARENWGLAVDGALPFRRTQHAFEDIKGEALLQVWKAFTTWDPDKGTLATWAERSVAGGVKREVRRSEYTEISYSDWSQRPKVIEAEKRLREVLGVTPTHEQIAEDTGLTVTIVQRIRAPRPVSFDTPVGEDGASTLGDLVAAKADETRTGLSEADLETLESHLGCLTPVELWLMIARNGLAGAPPLTLVEVSETLGLGREILRRRENEAEAKIKRTISGGGLQLQL